MKRTHTILFYLGYLIASILSLSAGASAFISNCDMGIFTFFTIVFAFLILDLRIFIIDELLRFLPKRTPHVLTVTTSSSFSAFSVGGLAGIIDSVSIAVVGLLCWFIFKWFAGDTTFLSRHFAHPKWIEIIVFIVIFLAFMFISIALTFSVFLLWESLLQKRKTGS